MDSFQEFDVAIILNEDITGEQKTFILNALEGKGFQNHYLDDKKLNPEPIIFTRASDSYQLLREADRMRLPKKNYHKSSDGDSGYLLRKFLAKSRESNLDPKIVEAEKITGFDFAKRKNFLMNPPTNEEHIPKETISADKNDSNGLKGFKKIMDQAENPKTQALSEQMEPYLKIFTPSELLQIKWSLIDSIKIISEDEQVKKIFNLQKITDKRIMESNKMIEVLSNIGVIKDMTPLHTHEIKNSCKNINTMTSYFGPNVSIYFQFMSYYTRMLIGPAIFGLFITFFNFQNNLKYHYTLEASYAVFIVIWSILFTKFWNRESSATCARWGTFGKTFRVMDERLDFRGEIRTNLITELPELHYPQIKRRFRFLISILCSVPIFVVTFYAMIIFLNMRGYIQPQHAIYIEYFSSFSWPGAIFDKTKPQRMVASILQVIFLIVFAKVNKAISEKTTVFENHRTHTSFNNSLILKRFLFEVVGAFSHLAYVAFWVKDISALEKEIIALFAGDEIRRVVTESLIPYIQKKYNATHYEKIDLKKTDLTEEEKMKHYIIHKVIELKEGTYDSFDDYLEMVLQYGYIVLFPMIFPLSGAISIIFNSVERQSDAFKLQKNFRRPVPKLVNGIGSWAMAMDVMGWMCVVTNAILIVQTYIYRVQTEEEYKQNSDAIDEIFIFEHLMLLVALIIRSMIHDEPFWVRILQKRRAHKS